MSEPELVADAGPELRVNSTAAMIRSLGLTATVCGLIIVSSYLGTLNAVAEN